MTGPILQMRSWDRIFVAVAGTLLCFQPLAAQSAIRMADQEVLASETYVRPPAVIERIIMAPRTDVSFTQPSPDRNWFLKTTGLDRGDVAHVRQAAHLPRRPAGRDQGEPVALADDQHEARADARGPAERSD